jgi:hypothetical protein
MWSIWSLLVVAVVQALMEHLEAVVVLAVCLQGFLV